jgi:hypothetical protein
MKSLATTFLIFVTCIVVAGTIALIDQAEVTIAASSAGGIPVGANVSGVRDAATLAEFAKAVQEKFRLAQPSDPIAFDDLRPNDHGMCAGRSLLSAECSDASASGSRAGQHFEFAGTNQPPHPGANSGCSHRCS